VQGVDVSKYQHDDGRAIDWAAVKRSGQAFAFLKATGGSNRVDPWFTREWAAAGRAGMVRGAYHYADPSSNPEAQAALVVQTVGSTREASNLGIVLDIEDDGGLAPAALAAWAHRFLDAVEARTGRTPILYTYVYFWQHAMANNRSFGAYPLWLARYADQPPAPVAGWSQWTFWQHSSSYRVPGIVGSVDHNYLCCSAGTLTALADGRSRQIAALWRRLGGASGALGLPLGPETAVPGGWGQVFQKGFVATTRDHGTHAVLSPLWDRYRASGAGTGSLGVPTEDARVVAPGVTQQLFAGGRILYSAVTGAHALTGQVERRWARDGAVRSQEGLPTGELAQGRQQFLGGGLYVTPTGVHLVPGAIRDRYEELGGPASVLGLPTSDAPVLLDGATLVTFDVGQLVEVVLAGQHVVL
jgi:GH25 family lysozyme M1 (1,4-beta-N-acetylmuramidase)